jgi:hypothetical protein
LIQQQQSLLGLGSCLLHAEALAHCGSTSHCGGLQQQQTHSSMTIRMLPFMPLTPLRQQYPSRHAAFSRNKKKPNKTPEMLDYAMHSAVQGANVTLCCCHALYRQTQLCLRSKQR